MQATDVLMEEHRVIEKVLAALEIAANRLAAGQEISMDFFTQAADFIKNFADGSHHKKEEGILFTALEENGMPREAGPLGVMLMEHEQGRHFTRAMREGAEKVLAGDDSAKQQVIQNALGYAALLSQHIQKEDQVLFPMANQVIPRNQHSQIMEMFRQVEDEIAVHEKYLCVADELASAVK
jgi:hemerythrin-like domain-containing protein